MAYTVGKDPRAYDFVSIQAAVDHAAKSKLGCTIYVESGVYQETVKIYQDHLTIVCEAQTILQSDLAALQLVQGEPRGTFRTATLMINGRDIVVQGLTVKNTAGPGEQVGQAVAVYLEGTDIYFADCCFDAYQDTLCLGPLPAHTKEGNPLISPWLKKCYPQQNRFFIDCEINGTVDMIFGGGNAYFDHCQLHCKQTMQNNYLTAAATAPAAKGFVFENCRITGAKKYALGRPWRIPAKVCFMTCHFDGFLIEEGWQDWGKTDQRQAVFFAEYNCTYTKPQQRAAWIDMKGMRLE